MLLYFPRVTVMPSYSLHKRLRAMLTVQKPLLTHMPTDPPRLKDLEFLPHTMTLESVASDERSLPLHNGYPPATQSTAMDTPSQQSILNGTRYSSPPPPEPDGIRSPSALSSQPGTPSNETVPGWCVSEKHVFSFPTHTDLGCTSRSAAVGRASLGKSGRVIEKLMGENDMHRREKALAKLQRDEEVKQHESTKSRYDALRVSHDNLQAIHESDNAAIVRKDRKLDELKAELELERTARKKAEDETRIARRERDEDVEKYRKEAMHEHEQHRGAANSYEVLRSSFKSLEQQYKRQVQKLRSDLQAIENLITKEQATNAHLSIISDQSEKEVARQQRINEDLQSRFDAYKLQNDELLVKIKRMAERNEVSTAEALEEVQKVVGEMRHTINVARDLRDPS